VQKIFWYHYSDWEFNRQDAEENFGMRIFDGYPRAMYSVMVNMQVCFEWRGEEKLAEMERGAGERKVGCELVIKRERCNIYHELCPRGEQCASMNTGIMTHATTHTTHNTLKIHSLIFASNHNKRKLCGLGRYTNYIPLLL
jgi:hypothetical protein